MLPTDYRAVQRETASGKSIERQLLQQVTTRLRAADSSTVNGLSKLHEALRLNQRLWRTFATDLAAPSNPHAPELKASIISLASYVERSTDQASRSSTLLGSLIDINEMIIAGLGETADERLEA